MPRVACALMAAGLMFATQAAGAASAEPRRPPSIEVTADAEVEVPPDLALLDFGVTTQAETAAAAAKQNSERMSAVLGAVRKALGPSARLSTGTYALRPDYAVARNGTAPPKITGYTATNVIQLRTAELPRLGEIIDLAIKAGANQVQRVTLTLSDAAPAQREALRDAVLKARGKAEAIAAALGLTISGVYTVVEQDFAPVRPLMRSAMVAQAEAAPVTPIESGLIQVRARVALTVEVAR